MGMERRRLVGLCLVLCGACLFYLGSTGGKVSDAKLQEGSKVSGDYLAVRGEVVQAPPSNPQAALGDEIRAKPQEKEENKQQSVSVQKHVALRQKILNSSQQRKKWFIPADPRIWANRSILCPPNTQSMGDFCGCEGDATCKGSRCALGHNRLSGLMIHGFTRFCDDCVCHRERQRRLVLCISLPRSGSTALSQLVKAYGQKIFTFVEPCRWIGLHNCNIMAFSRCEVFDWPSIMFYHVYWAYACDFMGDITPGFRLRCQQRILTRRDITMLKQQCLNADTIFIKFIAHTADVVESLLPKVRDTPTKIFILLRNVSTTVQSMYAAEMQWYSRQPIYRTPFASLATNFCQANQVLLRLQQEGATTVDYSYMSLNNIDHILQLIGIESNPEINTRVLTKKHLSLSSREFPFPWSALECQSAALQTSMPENCSISAPKSDPLACFHKCVCRELPRSVALITSLPSRTIATLSHIIRAHSGTIIFLYPCNGMYPRDCKIEDFRSCAVFDWNLASFYRVLHPTMCDFLGELTHGFVVRCKRQSLIGRDFGILRQLCLQASAVVVVVRPEFAKESLLGSHLPPSLPILTLRDDFAVNLDYAWTQPRQRNEDARTLARAVCRAYTTLESLDLGDHEKLSLKTWRLEEEQGTLISALRFCRITTPNLGSILQGTHQAREIADSIQAFPDTELDAGFPCIAQLQASRKKRRSR